MHQPFPSTLQKELHRGASAGLSAAVYQKKDSPTHGLLKMHWSAQRSWRLGPSGIWSLDLHSLKSLDGDVWMAWPQKE